MFDWLRLKDMGGTVFSTALLERVDREVATDYAREVYESASLNT